MESQPGAVFFGNILYVAAILGRQYYISNAGALCRKYFLFYASHGQYAAAERDFAGHSNTRGYTRAPEARHNARGNRDARRRAILGNGTLREMYVKPVLLEHLLVDAELLRMGPYPLERNRGRFLHHIAQIARQRQLLALAGRERRLGKQYLAAHARPRQAGDNSGEVIALVLAGTMHGQTEYLAQMLRLYNSREVLATHLCKHGLANHFLQLFLKLTHTTFGGIVLDDGAHGCRTHLHIAVAQSGMFQDALHQVAFGYLLLFLGEVAAEFYYLHTVEQRRRHGGERVGRGDEQDVGEVEVQIHVVVVEMEILLRVQHLQQGRGRVALEVVAYLVNLVKQKHGIVAPGTLHGVNYTSGHRADVGAAVAAYLGLVMQTAERHALVILAQCVGHALAQTRLAHARRANQAYYGLTSAGIAHYHRQLLQDALLHFLQTVMLPLQRVGGSAERRSPVAGQRLAYTPRQRHHRVDVGVLYGIVRT